MNELRLVFLDIHDKKHYLLYNIHDNDLAQRWIQITKQNQAQSGSYLNARITNVGYGQIDLVRGRLDECIKSINTQYDQPLPLYSDIKELTTHELNYLHEEFERYGDRHLRGELGTRWNTAMHNDFLKLNELIHLYEDVLTSKEKESFNLRMAMLWDYYPQGLHLPIEERDKLHLEKDLKWGGLYLGYNTLGKDWMKVCQDNDIDVIERDQVRPQRRFAAETWANFGPDVDPGITGFLFESWWKTLPQSLQSRVPINNLNELTLGRFRIGTLNTGDYFIRQYGGTKDAYIAHRHPIKAEWNRDVFSTFTKLIDVNFKE